MTDQTNEPQQDQAEQPQSDIVPVDDLTQFVQTLTRWHSNKVAILEHFLQIPEGTEAEITNNGQAETLVIAGDVRRGFIAGINLALMNLGKLPFAVEYEQPADGAANDAAG